jgi:predicted phage terminase large subunit-like protein
MLAFSEILNLIVTVPPQHGKSDYWSRYFTAWYLGTFPDKRVAFCSYAGNYARSWGLKTRRVIEAKGQELFGISCASDSHKADDFSIAGKEGGMITAGVDGSLTGRGADLGIVDDPIKNHAEAFSLAHKNKIWDWWDSTFGSRIHEGAKKVVIATRWAEDDLTGRLLELKKKGLEHWTVVNLPALAEEDESLFGFTRKKGEALCPEIYSQATLEARKKKTAPFWWATMYQGAPFVRDGDHFKRDWFRKTDELAVPFLKCRSWDLAASENPKAKRTAGMLVSRSTLETYCIENAVKGRWAPGRRNKIIKRIAQLDGYDVPILIEQEPASGGIAQVDEIKRMLPGWTVYSINASTEGSKILRADALSGQAELGFISMKRAPWNEDFLDEAAAFPGGPTIDMIDAAANGYNWLAAQDGPTEIPDDYDSMSGSDGRLFSGAGTPTSGRIF